ncbi:hypothetical protein Ddye_004053, partial [Dipteronia dyeriana]
VRNTSLDCFVLEPPLRRGRIGIGVVIRDAMGQVMTSCAQVIEGFDAKTAELVTISRMMHANA